MDDYFLFKEYDEIVIYNPFNLYYNRFPEKDLLDVLDKFKKNIYTDVRKKFVSSNTENNIYVKPTIITGYNCNYKCKYCFQNKSKIKETMKIEMINSIKKFYLEYEKIFKHHIIVDSLRVIGGEPLLESNREIIKTLFQSWGNSNFEIITNGSSMDSFLNIFEEHRDKIEFKISIDGIKKMHYKRRKPSQKSLYEDTIKNLKLFVDLDYMVTVMMVYDYTSNDLYSEFLDKMEKIGWLNKKNFKITLIPQYLKTIDYIDLENFEYLNDLKQNDDRIKKVNYMGFIPGLWNAKEAMIGNVSLSEYRCKKLQIPSYAFFPNGEVHFCEASPSEKTLIGLFYPEIKINTKKIEELKKRTIKKLSKCKYCKFKLVCKGGCPITSLENNNDLMIPYCGLWKYNEMDLHYKNILNDFI